MAQPYQICMADIDRIGGVETNLIQKKKKKKGRVETNEVLSSCKPEVYDPMMIIDNYFSFFDGRS